MTVQLTDEQKENSKIYVSFVNILFAVVLGQSFPLMTERIINGNPVSPTFVFDLFTMILMYIIVAFSWFGYHTSTSSARHPLLSMYRVFIDIFILFLYYLGFVYATVATFMAFSIVFTLVFLAYTIWDFLKIWEYKQIGHNIEHRWAVSFSAAILSALIVFMFLLLGGAEMYMGVGLGFQYVIALGYRALKTWKRNL